MPLTAPPKQNLEIQESFAALSRMESETPIYGGNNPMNVSMSQDSLDLVIRSSYSFQEQESPDRPKAAAGSGQQRSSSFEAMVHIQIDRLEITEREEPKINELTYADLAKQIQGRYGVPVDGAMGGFLQEANLNIGDSVDLEKLKDYFSPEKTADRIVTFATSFMDAFSSIHPEMAKSDRMSGFRDLIEGAITDGFDQATGLLGDDLPDEVKSVLDETRALITQKLDEYFARLEEPAKSHAESDVKSDAKRIAPWEVSG